MNSKTTFTYQISIYLAGDIHDARRVCKNFCRENKCCVTVSETSYIYPGGEEFGVVVGLLNYPRFEVDTGVLTDQSITLAQGLLKGCFQDSVLIVTPENTIWFSRRDA